MAKAHTLAGIFEQIKHLQNKETATQPLICRGDYKNMDQFRKEGAVQGQKVSIGPIALWGDVGICSKIIFNISDLMSPFSAHRGASNSTLPTSGFPANFRVHFDELNLFS